MLAAPNVIVRLHQDVMSLERREEVFQGEKNPLKHLQSFHAPLPLTLSCQGRIHHIGDWALTQGGPIHFFFLLDLDHF